MIPTYRITFVTTLVDAFYDSGAACFSLSSSLEELYTLAEKLIVTNLKAQRKEQTGGLAMQNIIDW